MAEGGHGVRPRCRVNAGGLADRHREEDRPPTQPPGKAEIPDEGSALAGEKRVDHQVDQAGELAQPAPHVEVQPALDDVDAYLVPGLFGRIPYVVPEGENPAGRNGEILEPGDGDPKVVFLVFGPLAGIYPLDDGDPLGPFARLLERPEMDGEKPASLFSSRESTSELLSMIEKIYKMIKILDIVS